MGGSRWPQNKNQGEHGGGSQRHPNEHTDGAFLGLRFCGLEHKGRLDP